MTGFYLKISRKAFKLIYGDRFILYTSPAVFFTGMRTNPAARKKEGVTFPNGLHRSSVIAAFDLRDIFGNVDFRRTGLAAWGEGVVFLVEMEKPLRQGSDL